VSPLVIIVIGVILLSVALAHEQKASYNRDLYKRTKDRSRQLQGLRQRRLWAKPLPQQVWDEDDS